ncbi:hypothetical protein HYW84_04165 [Candidatus Peregrinibacteria bacterium]|nr:hypothetical protein [Candidatus Peregrinibacteria bacterium]
MMKRAMFKSQAPDSLGSLNVPRSNIIRVIAICSWLIALSGCSVSTNPLTGSGAVRDILRTASGYVLEAGKQAAAAVEYGKMEMQKGKETVEEMKKRAYQVQQGIEAVKEGKELIQKGLTR